AGLKEARVAATDRYRVLPTSESAAARPPARAETFRGIPKPHRNVHARSIHLKKKLEGAASHLRRTGFRWTKSSALRRSVRRQFIELRFANHSRGAATTARQLMGTNARAFAFVLKSARIAELEAPPCHPRREFGQCIA